MSPSSRFRAAGCLAALLLSSTVAGAEPRRILLEPPGLEEAPMQASAPVELAGRYFFQATDPLHGYELWVADGEDLAAARRLTDLCPGICGIYAGNLMAIGERVFFTLGDLQGNALYAIDGDQVSLVLRFPGYLSEAVAFGGQLYFDVSLLSDKTIYRSNGQPGDLEPFDRLCGAIPGECQYSQLEVAYDGLYYLKEGKLVRVAAGGDRSELIDLERMGDPVLLGGGRFVFWGCQAFDCVMYASDGSAAGTRRILPGDPLSDGRSAKAWNGQAYWITDGGQLVRSDGTDAGTGPVPGIVAKWLIAATPTHLFYTRTGDTERDLRLRSLSAGGVDQELLAFDFFDPEPVGILGNSLFLAYNGQTLHVSDGTPAGTRLAERVAGSLDSIVIGGRLYFQAHTLTSQRVELWSFDQAGNAEAVFPPRLAPRGDNARPIVAGNSLFAWADGDFPRFWSVDPFSLEPTPLPFDGPPLLPLLPAGDRLLAHTRTHPDQYFSVTAAGIEALPIEPRGGLAAAADGKLFWSEADPGQKLFTDDGIPGGRRLIFDFDPGWTLPSCSRRCPRYHPSSLALRGDLVYFVAADQPSRPDWNGEAAVWVYRRSSGEIARLMDFLESSYTNDPYFFPAGGKVVFQIDAPPEKRGLWASDGTPAGTRRIVAADSNSVYYTVLGAVGELIFFTEGNRLFTSDFNPGGARLLLAAPDLVISGSAAAVAGDHFFFAAATDALGLELWTSDGTAAGTRAFDLRPGPLGSRPSSLLGVGERLVFAADRGSHGYELYQSDGTLEGTTLLADIAPSQLPSTPSYLKAVGERLFFDADDGASGRGLWSLDLPAPRPGCPAGKLCLQNGRFELSVTAQGQHLVEGSRVLASAESGVFSFFAPNNWELLVKVLDGCAINQRFWVYSAAATDVPFTLKVLDRATGEQREYSHPGFAPAAPALDSDAFATCGAPAPPGAYSAVLPPAGTAPRCGDEVAAFCFGPNGRFRARAVWQTPAAGGAANPAPFGSHDSGIFTYFSPSNWELMVKVLDGCAINGYHWVFVAGTTDVGWNLEIEDRVEGQVRSYGNVAGNARPAVADSSAFACN
jgi:ELWxxDGT repeat protein